MTEYLLSISGLVLFTTILTNILPGGKTSALLKGIFRLCAYLTLLSPIVTFMENYSTNDGNFFKNYFENSVIKTDSNYIEYCNEKNVAKTERFIKKKLQEEYFVDVKVSLSLEETEEGLKIKKIIVVENDISSEKQEEIIRDFKNEYSVDIQFTKGG